MKQVPEMSLKLTCNDRVKARFTANGRQVTLTERLAIGGVSGALAQVRTMTLTRIKTLTLIAQLPVSWAHCRPASRGCHVSGGACDAVATHMLLLCGLFRVLRHTPSPWQQQTHRCWPRTQPVTAFQRFANPDINLCSDLLLLTPTFAGSECCSMDPKAAAA